MKQIVKLLPLLMVAMALSGCPGQWVGDDGLVDDSTEYYPVFMSRDVLNSSVKSTQPIALQNPGKIYIKDDLLLINEKYRGVHVYNNSQRNNPIEVAFITAPGCLDMAVKNKILYLDNAVDLVAVDLSDFNNVVVTKRINNVFPEPTPPDANRVPGKYEGSGRPANSIIVNWNKNK